jgi:AraC family transcriptional regulator
VQDTNSSQKALSPPVLSEIFHDFGEFSVSRVRVEAGACELSPRGQLRIAVTLDARWDTHIFGGRTYAHDRGEICMFPPQLMRETRIREGGEGILISVNESIIDRLALEVGATSPWETFRFHTLSDPVVHRLVWALGNEFKANGNQGPMFSESVVITLLGYLLRAEQNIRDSSPTKGGLTTAQLRHCQEFIEANLTENITLDDLSRTANVSLFHFIRAFKKSTGMTPHRYILDRRVRNAETLLISSNDSVGDIAKAVGFLSAGHFSSAFQKILQIAPTAYRRANGASSSEVQTKVKKLVAR